METKFQVCEGIRSRPHIPIVFWGEPMRCPLCDALDKAERAELKLREEVGRAAYA